ncbi:hypothetical protein E3P99_03696 [Wallemia hederae]|uniref:Small ribosomal subunit protein mS33 n=1 Tax=Wallemia hederae TaxID=1540922 RepID=A0A4T0FGA7_9BASI|nr:hypothetical protein E3P99_03696 [Wallemia hederae]
MLRALLEKRAAIFDQNINKFNIRNGFKYLNKRLVGPKALEYYPPQINIQAFKQLNNLPSSWVTNKEKQRLIDVDARKRRGKSPPKKGQGRRSSMKKK